MLIPLRHRAARPHARRDSAPANPLYGYGYNPAWPSILSIAHDTTDGGRLFVVTDRPCVLTGSAAGLPLSVAGMSVLDCVEVLPIKFRLSMSGAVPHGSAWTWGPSAGNDLVDPITNNPLNPASGNCADVPGPYTPPPAVNILSVALAGTATVIVAFSGPIAVDSGVTPDTGFTIGDGGSVVPVTVSPLDATRVTLELSGEPADGWPWQLGAQPNWLVSPATVPQDGTVTA